MSNIELSRGLRELADFLDQHPDLPSFHGYVHARVLEQDARNQLERFAAIVPDPQESVSYGSVEIASRFAGDVQLELGASVLNLGGREIGPRYEYKPILRGDA